MDFILRYLKGDYLALALILPTAIAIMVLVAILMLNGYAETWDNLAVTLVNRSTP